MDFHPIQPPNLTNSTRQAYNVISMDFHPIGPPNLTDSTRHHLNEVGGQIGWKSTEITLYACLVESVVLGGQIGQIGWKSIEIMPGRIGVIGLQLPGRMVEFDRSNTTGI